MKPPDYQGPIRISGLRIAFEAPVVQPHLWAAIKKTIEPYAPLIAALREEPYYVDDGYRNLPLAVALEASLRNGELFLAIYKEQIIASIFITDIRADRDAFFEGWIHPTARKTYLGQKIALFFSREVFQYCFKPWSNGNAETDGLGLRKVKAKIADANRPSIRAALAIGFKQTGLSPLDALHHGQLYDNVEMELLNPTFFRPVLEKINGKATVSGTLHTSIASSSESGVHASSAGSDDASSSNADNAAADLRSDQPRSAEHVESSSDNERGSSSGEPAAELASAFERGESVEPGWDISVPAEL